MSLFRDSVEVSFFFFGLKEVDLGVSTVNHTLLLILRQYLYLEFDFNLEAFIEFDLKIKWSKVRLIEIKFRTMMWDASCM